MDLDIRKFVLSQTSFSD